MKAVPRHRLSTRLWHWANLVCVAMMLGSGLSISNAHRRLYWGDAGFEEGREWLAVPRWPDWMTIPGHYNLAQARDWHVLFAWPFAVLLAFMWLAMLINRHFWRDIATSPRDWRPAAILSDIRAHLRFDFDHGGGKYNFLQKLAYGLVLGLLLPGMVATGVAISPGSEPALPWLAEAMGGRQSARSLHFIFAGGVVAFIVVHVLLVLVSGPFRQIRDMITGGRDAA